MLVIPVLGRLRKENGKFKNDPQATWQAGAQSVIFKIPSQKQTKKSNIIIKSIIFYIISIM